MLQYSACFPRKWKGTFLAVLVLMINHACWQWQQSVFYFTHIHVAEQMGLSSAMLSWLSYKSGLQPESPGSLKSRDDVRILHCSIRACLIEKTQPQDWLSARIVSPSSQGTETLLPSLEQLPLSSLAQKWRAECTQTIGLCIIWKKKKINTEWQARAVAYKYGFYIELKSMVSHL